MLPGILAKQTGPGLSSSLLAKAYGRITGHGYQHTCRSKMIMSYLGKVEMAY